jgi:hypothetical protein
MTLHNPVFAARSYSTTKNWNPDAELIPRLTGVQSAERLAIQLTSGNTARLGKLFSGW